MAAAPPDRAFFGIQSWTFPNARDVALMKRGRVGTYRVMFDAAVQARPADARWAVYDEVLAIAARERIEVLPVLIGNTRGHPPLARPRTRAQRTAWAGFVTAVAARYGRGGTFWEAHPELQPIPLEAYQVWNEPNLPVFWRPSNDAAGYLRFVRLTRARLRAVDPEATIVLAGLPESRLGTPMLEYMRAIYAQPGARSLFDVVALHPYAADAPGVLAALNRVRAYMNRRGDHGTPIWVTEIGWATGGPRSPFTTTRAGQAARVSRTFRALLAARARLRLERIVYSALQDRAYGPTERPGWGPRLGLFDMAGRSKPAWRTYVGFTGGQAEGRLRSAAGRRR